MRKGILIITAIISFLAVSLSLIGASFLMTNQTKTFHLNNFTIEKEAFFFKDVLNNFETEVEKTNNWFQNNADQEKVKTYNEIIDNNWFELPAGFSEDDFYSYTLFTFKKWTIRIVQEDKPDWILTPKVKKFLTNKNLYTPTSNVFELQLWLKNMINYALKKI